MTPLAVALATAGDAAEQAAVIAAAIASDSDHTAETRDALAASWTPARVRSLDARWFVARSGVPIVGTANRRASLIGTVYVRPDAQRSGVGSALMDAAEADARAAGWSVVEVLSVPSAIGFYRARGYEETGLTMPSADLVLTEMSRRLAR